MGGYSKTTWERALACEIRARELSDPALKATFERLRDTWLSIGNFGAVTEANCGFIHQPLSQAQAASGV